MTYYCILYEQADTNKKLIIELYNGHDVKLTRKEVQEEVQLNFAVQ